MDNIDELKTQLDNADNPAEDTEDKDQKGDAGDGADGDGSDDEGDEGGDDQDKGAGDGDQFSMPDKFKGKSVEEVAKSYSELEKMHSQKIAELQKQIEENKKPAENGKGNDKPDEGDQDWEKMTPAQFAKAIIAEAKKTSQGVYQEVNQTKTEVGKEIAEAKKDYPNLIKNQAYKETVVAIMEASASQGKIMRLKDACEKVEALIGEKQKITDNEEKRMKQTKAQIETMGGSPSGGGKESEETRIKNGMMRGGGGTLGGLGI
jgi:hypothetical protein